MLTLPNEFCCRSRRWNNKSVYWSPTTDKNGNVWLEEYPGNPPTEALNGHIFAIFGLYEQWKMDPCEWLEHLLQGAITTAKNRAQTYRRKDQPSRYWSISEKYADRYHVIHIAQLLELYSMTADIEFAQVADMFWKDYPPYSFGGDFYLDAGTYEAKEYETDKPSINFGKSENIRLDDITMVRTNQRRRLPESEEYWYLCTTEPFSKMWLKENRSKGAFVQGEYVGGKSIGGPLYGAKMMYSPVRSGETKIEITHAYECSDMRIRFLLYKLSSRQG